MRPIRLIKSTDARDGDQKYMDTRIDSRSVFISFLTFLYPLKSIITNLLIGFMASTTWKHENIIEMLPFKVLHVFYTMFNTVYLF